MSDAHASHAAEHHEHPPVPYYIIFGTLGLFTAITIAASFMNFGSHEANVAVAIAIAAFKGSLVMIFFMHLKYEKRPIVLIALAPFFLLVVLLSALIPDIVRGQYHSDTQFGTPPAAEHAEHHEAK